jgi:hypothetical protein
VAKYGLVNSVYPHFIHTNILLSETEYRGSFITAKLQISDRNQDKRVHIMTAIHCCKLLNILHVFTSICTRFYTNGYVKIDGGPLCTPFSVKFKFNLTSLSTRQRFAYYIHINNIFACWYILTYVFRN